MRVKKGQKNRKGTNTLRIIGGEWRSRKLPVLDAQGLRPTPDRVRETLFNWLQQDIQNSRCLDLFAGTGALGFEALSRGASFVTFVEKNAAVAKQLQANCNLLKTAKAKIIQDDALHFLTQNTENNSYDMIFLDPPYRLGLLESSLKKIISNSLIHGDSLIYAEHEAEESIDWSEFNLTVKRETSAGQVKCCLLEPV